MCVNDLFQSCAAAVHTYLYWITSRVGTKSNPVLYEHTLIVKLGYLHMLILEFLDRSMQIALTKLLIIHHAIQLILCCFTYWPPDSITSRGLTTKRDVKKRPHKQRTSSQLSQNWSSFPSPLLLVPRKSKREPWERDWLKLKLHSDFNFPAVCLVFFKHLITLAPTPRLCATREKIGLVTGFWKTTYSLCNLHFQSVTDHASKI